ncbi:MAG: ABC transporter permease [Clostridia bacterium]|nr:ABC transporter permease [Clostridiales bacterium]MBQ2975873.1 ABC transporter permease [Clostridia bacterium]MBQ6803684.1 ABC transporter permease [Clostridia bacterium]
MTQVLLGALSLGLLWAIMTIGVYITYRILDIADLTVEGSLPLGGAIACVLITQKVNPYLASCIALLGGCLAGLCTGLLHTKLKIPALLSGILTMIALYSINLRIMGSPNLSILRQPTVFKPLTTLGLDKNLSIIIVGVVASLLIITLLYWFFGTELGSSIRATGNNQKMVRAQGVNTDTMKILGLVISNGLVALSGALIAQSQNFADVQMGTGSIVIGLASLIIGEVLFGGRSFYRRLLALILGAVAYRIIIALVLKMGMNSNDLKLFTAITVAICLWLPQGKELIRKIKKSMVKEGA